ncbi:invasion associated locus B family protein [Roseovarius pelagicus]|uniref:Invasion associated locus B family protein n=1 Tax=Roseovarius pelagicus TaxID=2980108 RepID=A0ABY6DEM2_9RHOB|nr:invasion associated locus B family protein [Roseovarius pelagicus]UXX83673.1 invasion associated locus B family protein [Roseovarius pelagicus]
MPRSLSILAVALAATLGHAALAQEATTAEPEDSTAAEAAEGSATGDSAFSTGREVSEDESPTYIKETFGDWSLRCFRTQGEDDLCQLYQLLTEAEGNPVAEFSIFDIEDQGAAIAGGTVIVPLFTLLTEELKISVDGGNPKSYPYRVCTESGCIAQIGLTSEDIASFKRGAKATITLVPAQAADQKVRINVSLSGFTKGFDAVSVFKD